jgi:hypothetical protein
MLLCQVKHYPTAENIRLKKMEVETVGGHMSRRVVVVPLFEEQDRTRERRTMGGH